VFNRHRIPITTTARRPLIHHPLCKTLLLLAALPVNDFYRTAVLERLALTKPSAQKALHRLSARAEIEADGRKQAIVDPLFAEWIAALA